MASSFQNNSNHRLYSPGGAPRWGNQESQTYTNSTDNVYINDRSNLVITPLKDRKGNWTSSRMESVDSYICPEDGKLLIQSNVYLPTTPVAQQQGIWPAFWALGTAFRSNYTDWPAVTEWDFLETFNGLPTIFTTVHCGVAPGGPCKEYDGIGKRNNMTRGEWHEIGFEVDRTPRDWKRQTVAWYMDGQELFKVNGSMINDTAAWNTLVATKKYLILNVAVGGNFPNVFSLNGTTPTNQTIGGSKSSFEIDYVGVWRAA